jgi:hypothetical protein
MLLGGLLLWILRGHVKSHTNMETGNTGITEADAIIFAQALATKFMEKHKNKYATVIDPFLIALDIPCDVNNQS